MAVVAPPHICYAQDQEEESQGNEHYEKDVDPEEVALLVDTRKAVRVFEALELGGVPTRENMAAGEMMVAASSGRVLYPRGAKEGRHVWTCGRAEKDCERGGGRSSDGA